MATSPLTFWEYDELLFAGAVERFEPLLHHPHPPGYPVYVGLGKLVDLVMHDAFASLVVTGIALTIVGFLALSAAFRRLLGDPWLAVSGALLFYCSAGMLVHASLPLSDASALAFLALALWHSSTRGEMTLAEAALTGIAGSLAVGCRPQLAVMVVPLLTLVLLRRRSLRQAAVATVCFGAVSVAWLLPLVVSTGGLSGFLRYELSQAADFAANDADLARSGWRWSMLVLRFVAHPWGAKWLSAPVLAGAMVGFPALLLRRSGPAAPFLVSAAIYLGFAAATMDPVDGVRYALPATMAVALAAVCGFGAVIARTLGPKRSWVALPCAGAIAAGSVAYASPVLFQRHTTASPPWQAAAYARAHLPSDTVILFERPLQPHARQLFTGFASMPLEEDFGALVDQPEVPVTVLADGASDQPAAATFAWTDSDAYGKLTRNHYRVVSLIPVPPASRYRALAGVYRPERTVGGRSWRWLAPTASIALPAVGVSSIELRLGVPDDYPWESVGVSVRLNAGEPITAVVKPRAPATVVVDRPAGSSDATITIDSGRTFVPAEAPNLLQRDQRALGVMLLGVEQRR